MARHMFIARNASDGANGLPRSGGTARRTGIWVSRWPSRLAAGRSRRTLPSAKTTFAPSPNSTGLTSMPAVVLMTPEDIDAAAEQTVNHTRRATDSSCQQRLGPRL